MLLILTCKMTNKVCVHEARNLFKIKLYINNGWISLYNTSIVFLSILALKKDARKWIVIYFLFFIFYDTCIFYLQNSLLYSFSSFSSLSLFNSPFTFFYTFISILLPYSHEYFIIILEFFILPLSHCYCFNIQI